MNISLEAKVISREISELMWKDGITLATAESCTAGNLSAAITAIHTVVTSIMCTFWKRNFLTVITSILNSFPIPDTRVLTPLSIFAALVSTIRYGSVTSNLKIRKT